MKFDLSKAVADSQEHIQRGNPIEDITGNSLGIGSSPHRLMLCHKKLEIEGTNGMASTYCMKESGHKGKCK